MSSSQAASTPRTLPKVPNDVWGLCLPVVLGYLSVGMTFGLLAGQQGLSIWQTLGFSVIVFAGAAQFVCLSLIAAGDIGLASVFITIWLVNLRGFILSLSYLPQMKTWSGWQRFRLLPVLTDESFAVLTSARPEIRQDAQSAWTVSLINYAAWCLGPLLGFYFGTLIPDPKRLGLDYALVALLLAIIVLFLTRKAHVVTLSLAIVLAWSLDYYLAMGRGAVIVSALVASFIGYKVECRISGG